jgi:MFS family permease
MVSLLAGAATSPERFFGSYTPPKDPAEVQAEKNRERKAITALLNALLSIVGSAFATWWAAEMLGWRNEWVCVRCSVQPIHSMYSIVFKRVLLGLFVAILVAVTEGALFLLWQSRAKGPRRKRRLPAANHKKVDTEKEDPVHAETDGIISTTSTSTTADYHVSDLRQRK